LEKSEKRTIGLFGHLSMNSDPDSPKHDQRENMIGVKVIAICIAKSTIKERRATISTRLAVLLNSDSPNPAASLKTGEATS
jgi:hypothetical protein